MLNINGTPISEKCTVLEGITFLHVLLRDISPSTQTYIESIQDESVYFSYTEGDEFYEYLHAKIIYLGNNTLYVSSWIN